MTSAMSSREETTWGEGEQSDEGRDVTILLDLRERSSGALTRATCLRGGARNHRNLRTAVLHRWIAIKRKRGSGGRGWWLQGQGQGQGGLPKTKEMVEWTRSGRGGDLPGKGGETPVQRRDRLSEGAGHPLQGQDRRASYTGKGAFHGRKLKKQRGLFYLIILFYI